MKIITTFHFTFLAFRITSVTKKMSRNASTSIEDIGFQGEKLVYPAATRNQEPILQVLKKYIKCNEEKVSDNSPLFLEIASGSGQHLFHFAPHFPGLKFQPSEYDASLLGSINYYATHCLSKNILVPLHIDICKKLSVYGLKENSIEYIYCANMIHISPYECTIGLFENAGIYLKPGSLLFTYGPYKRNGIIVPQSNVNFDASLKSRDPTWGLRDINDLEKLAKDNNIILINELDMPANNKTLIWKKNGEKPLVSL